MGTTLFCVYMVVHMATIFSGAPFSIIISFFESFYFTMEAIHLFELLNGTWYTLGFCARVSMIGAMGSKN